MARVFISYRRADSSSLAYLVSRELELRGIDCFLDTRNIDGGGPFPDRLRHAIDEAQVVLVLLGATTFESEWVREEIKHAHEHGKLLIPIFQERYTTSDPIPDEHVYALLQSDGVHILDVRNIFIEAAFDQLEQMLQHSLTDVPPEPIIETPPRIPLPAPFAWVEIPGGRGTLKTDEDGVTLSVPTETYWIGKYPVTNAQFAQFIEAGGYSNREWWTDAGWDAREKGYDWNSKSRSWEPSGTPWTEPRYWQDSKWNGDEYPVVGVSWYEAVAFCLWLSDATGEHVMLPTEAQWQYAAQGDTGWAYPWGDEWDCQRCNNSVIPCNSNVTTPVRQYEGEDKGDSPFGVVDMSGNVWEWCLTDYDNHTNDVNSNANRRVLRGGSWGNGNTVSFRVDVRGRNYPDDRDFFWGFRVVLS